jgi:hypothetical protein
MIRQDTGIRPVGYSVNLEGVYRISSKAIYTGYLAQCPDVSDIQIIFTGI